MSASASKREAGASILRLELEQGRVEWVAFNPQSKTLPVAGGNNTELLVCATGTNP